ncbi:MAG: penicillin-binding protein 2 [Acidimicrobiales bacterium]
MTGQFNPRLRLGLIGLVVLSLFGAMFTRLWYLQVLNAPSFRAAADTNQVRRVFIPAPRGRILDRNGQVIVGNQVVEAITLDRTQAKKHPSVVTKLAALLAMTPAQVNQIVNDQRYSFYRPAPIAVNVSKDIAIYVDEHRSQLPGVAVQLMTQRFYPHGELAAQVVGYVGDITGTELKAYAKDGYQPGDLIGQSGIEAQYEQYLRGTPGEKDLEVDPAGRVLKTLSYKPPVPGDDVQLSLDIGTQTATEAALAQQVLHNRKTRDPTNGVLPPTTGGAAVVLSPKDGSVLAMASYPTYNPTIWVGGISTKDYQAISSAASNYPQLNRAIAGLYTPGSTFKLATATAALNAGVVGPNTLIRDPGYFRVPNCKGPFCVSKNDNGESFGAVAMTKAITVSDDVYFYTLGYDFWANQAKYGPTPIQDTAHAYGLGRATNVDLPGEQTGFIASPALRAKLHAQYPSAYPNGVWYAGDNVRMAIGQAETNITPLQLANAYATFANGGTLYQPRVAARVLSPSGRVVKDFAPTVLGHVKLSPSDHSAMLAGFDGVTANPLGTAASEFVNFPLSTFPVGGKTGTADVGPPKEPNSLFAAFAPAGPSDQPAYAMAVALEQAGYGAAVAAPISRSILAYLQAHPIGGIQDPPPAGPAQVSANSPTPTTAAPGGGQATTLPGGTTATTGPQKNATILGQKGAIANVPTTATTLRPTGTGSGRSPSTGPPATGPPAT